MFTHISKHMKQATLASLAVEHKQLQEQWKLSARAQELLSGYYLMLWSKEWTISQLESGNSIIFHRGFFYSVRYTNKLGLNGLLSCPEDAQIKLSFRHTKKGLYSSGINRYVLIQYPKHSPIKTGK